MGGPPSVRNYDRELGATVTRLGRRLDRASRGVHTC